MPEPDIAAVYFDIGETLIDRSREYGAIAHELGVPAHTFSAVFGGVIAQGGTVDDVLARFGSTRLAARSLKSVPAIGEVDLYPDVRECLHRLQVSGLRVGVVGNQPAGFSAELKALNLPADDVATSADWGVAKPDPRFFARLVASAGVAPAQIVYVGDQLDNDVVPALAAGLQAVRLLRGPWGALIRDDEIERRCLAVVDNLDELADLLTAGSTAS
jgi:HAD superfamily hydrolase (TIGR01549 family)